MAFLPLRVGVASFPLLVGVAPTPLGLVGVAFRADVSVASGVGGAKEVGGASHVGGVSESSLQLDVKGRGENIGTSMESLDGHSIAI